jgi:hypothetical protein
MSEQERTLSGDIAYIHERMGDLADIKTTLRLIVRLIVILLVFLWVLAMGVIVHG